MSTISSLNMEQPDNKRRTPKTERELRAESIQRIFAGKTDRQLLEEQTYLAQIDNENIESIKKNVQFFFWMTLISIVGWAIIIFATQNN